MDASDVIILFLICRLCMYRLAITLAYLYQRAQSVNCLDLVDAGSRVFHHNEPFFIVLLVRMTLHLNHIRVRLFSHTF